MQRGELMEYTRINWQNTADTPLNATNLNKMDKGIAELLNELNSLKQLEKLAVFPNQANSRISNSVNFKSDNGYTLTYGTLDVSDSKLIVINEEYASTQLTAELKSPLTLNADKNILLKLRAKATTNASIYPKLGLTDGTSVFVPNTTILAGNLYTNSTPYYSLKANEWADIWCIIGADVDTEIESIVLHIAPYGVLEIASFYAFYSIDKCNGGGVEVIDSGVEINLVQAYSNVTESDIAINTISFTEGEI